MVALIRAFTVGVTMSFIEMGSNKMRSFLSMLGILLGVGSLVAILTLIGGIDVFLHQKMGKWVGAIWIFQQRDMPADQKLQSSRSPGMRFSDGAYLKDASRHVKSYTAQISRWGQSQFIFGDEWVNMTGTTAQSFADDKASLRLTTGRWLNDNDYENGRRVCVVPWELYDKIQTQLEELGRPAEDVLKTTVTFRGTPLAIVGTFEPVDTNSVRFLSRSVLMPLATMQRYFSGTDPNPGRMQVNVADPENVLEQAKLVSADLAKRHRGVTDFEYRTAEWLDNLKKTLNNISLLMGIVSTISLLSGGLSIMNVMLSSIAERIKEIGVRKALGARNSHVFIQFVTESVVLCVCGGVLGLVPGMIPLFFKDVLAKASNGAIIPTILPQHIAGVLLLVICMGIAFGLYPAIKAARLNPVDALRYE